VFAVIGILVLVVAFRIHNRSQNGPDNPGDSGNPVVVDDQGPVDDSASDDSSGTAEVKVVDALNVSYGSEKGQVYDFYASKEKSDTLIVIVHGGAWVLGDKGQFTPMSKFFASKGYSVINMNYRLAPKFTYPAPLEDMATVLGLVKADPAKFNLKDNYKVAMMGHSAGAHLVSLFGVTESKYGADNATYVVSLAGPDDMTTTAATYDLKQTSKDAFYSFMGKASVADVDPTKQVQAGEKTEYLLLLGDKDPGVKPFNVENFEKALKDNGATVYSWIVPGRDHNTLVSGIQNDDEVAKAILKFLGGGGI
jgi:acetyl esterase/lipase